MRWTWDPDKDAINRRKHRLPLSIGEVALGDPLALSRQDSHPDEEAIRHALAGNLCRCTGYQTIVESIQAAAIDVVSS